jgi:transcriptional regulator PpsR
VQLQKRLVEAQQAMERDYWRFREAETRYRNLFQTASEAVLIVDASSLRVVEANPAAETLWARSRTRLVGAVVTGLFDPVSADGVQSLLAATRMVGPREPVRAALIDGRTHVAVSASAFRQDAATFLLVRATPWRSEVPVGAPARLGRRGAVAPAGVPVLEAWADHLPDAHAFTDAQGRIVAANRAFAALAQLTNAEQARGRMLDQWVGNTGVELSVLLGNLRQHGSMGLFITTLRGEFGASADIEIAAATLPPDSGAALVFALRDVGRRSAAAERGAPRLPRSAHEMTELVGRVPLKQIVSETTDLIEQLCIETALQMTGDNRASAAQLLGLSRQSLYVKLRRFGLGESSGDPEPAAV